MKLDTLVIVGVGLLGGSIGLAVRRRGLARRIVGVNHQPDGLGQAIERGAIDEGTLDLSAAAREADLVVLCTPVDAIVPLALSAAEAAAPGRIVMTDVGSAKGEIVRSLRGKLPAGKHFVGSHPLAGSEKHGVAYARPDLFDGCVTVVTPDADTDAAAVKDVTGFWQALGCEVRRLSPEAHDEALALTSHVPHALAAALAGLLPRDLFPLTATGFRDTTRVAAGDPALWAGIFQQNRSAVLAALARLRERLQQFERAVAANDRAAVDEFLAHAKKVRDALGSGDLPQE